MTTTVKPSLLDILQSYSDLCREIDLLEIEKENIEAEWKIYHTLMFVNPRGGFNGGIVSVPLENVAERLDKLKDKHDLVEKLLEVKTKYREKAKFIMGQFEGIEYRVAYMRFVEKERLEDIAEKLDYSLDWIKKVSARVSRHLEGTDILQNL
jgi:excinuclease UvrABC helicase subunit UvrB